MPIQLYVDAKLETVFSKATGVFTHAEAVEHGNRIARHPDFRPEFNELLDLREVTQMKFSGDEVGALAQRRIYSTRSKRAFVVASDVQFGLSRMYEIHRELAGPPYVMAFYEMAEALSWLSLSAAPSPTLFT